MGVKYSEVESRSAQHRDTQNDDLHGHGPRKIVVPRKPEIDQEAAVGVNIDIDNWQRQRSFADVHMSDFGWQLELDVIHANGAVDFVIDDFKAESRQLLRTLSAQADQQTVEVGVV